MTIITATAAREALLVAQNEMNAAAQRVLAAKKAVTEAEAVTTEIYLVTGKDKYGRSCTTVDRLHKSATGEWLQRDRDLAVVVCMPKTFTAVRPGERYLVNVRPGAGAYQGDVTYHATRKAALAHAVANLNK